MPKRTVLILSFILVLVVLTCKSSFGQNEYFPKGRPNINQTHSVKLPFVDHWPLSCHANVNLARSNSAVYSSNRPKNKNLSQGQCAAAAVLNHKVGGYVWEDPGRGKPRKCWLKNNTVFSGGWQAQQQMRRKPGYVTCLKPDPRTIHQRVADANSQGVRVPTWHRKLDEEAAWGTSATGPGGHR